MRECAVCGEENPVSLTECRWCGTDLTAPDPIQEADLTNPPSR